MTPQERVRRIRPRYVRRSVMTSRQERITAAQQAANDALIEEIEAAVKDEEAGLTYAAIARELGTDRRLLHALKRGWEARQGESSGASATAE